MKLLIVTSELSANGGGLSKACKNFIALIEKLGNEVKIALSEFPNNNFANQYSSYLIAPEFKILNGGYKPGLKKILYLEEFKKQLNKFFDVWSPEIIISFGAGKNGLFASELAFSSKLRFILLLRGSEINLSLFDMDLRQANMISLMRSHHIIGLSNELINKSKLIYNNLKAKYDVIPNAIQLKINLQDENNFDSNKIKFGLAARFVNEKKGIYNLIEALKILKSINIGKEWELDIIGEIDNELLNSYKKKAGSLILEKNVNFKGFLHRDLLFKEMQTWQFTIQTSFFEGMSNTIAESIKLNIPILISNTGFVAESLRDHFPEIIIPNNTPSSIAKSIASFSMLNNKKEILVKIITLLSTELNPDTISTKWDSILKNKMI